MIRKDEIMWGGMEVGLISLHLSDIVVFDGLERP